MKFKLVENINSGLENESAMGVLDEELGVRFYLGQNGSKIGGLFTATGKLLKQLWDEDDEHYDDINYHLSQLEDLFDVPDLDYKNNNYNFAFKKSFITDEVREIIDNLNFYLNEIDYEIIEETIDVPNIEYQDDNQFAYKALDEDVLNEKMWVEVTPMENNKPISEPFYFYSTNKNVQNDVDTLLPIINNSQTGTYKQQLNQDIVNKLKALYVSCNKRGTTFSLRAGRTGIKNIEMSKDDMITLADRDLRTNAHIDIKGINSDDYLIHHKLKGEYDNDYKNMFLISKDPGLHFAHAVHKILEYYGTSYPTGSVSVPIIEFDTHTTKWKQTHSVDIIFR